MKYLNEKLLLMDPIEVYELRTSGLISKFPRNFFYINGKISMDVCVKLIRYLIEEKLKWTYKDVCEKLSYNTFVDNKLDCMLKYVFNGCPYYALNSAYPGKYKPWQLRSVPKGFWNKKTGIKATKWLIEKKLKWTYKDVCEKLTLRTFIDNGLGSMIKYVFNGCLYDALNGAYPGKYKPWQLRSVPKGFWNKETAIEATIWLIEEKLKWTDEDVCERLSYNTFANNGLSGMINTIFNGRSYDALNSAYPGKYKKVGRKIMLAA